MRERRNLRLMEGSDAQDKCLQYDVIQWLCVRDQTYSQVGYFTEIVETLAILCHY